MTGTFVSPLFIAGEILLGLSLTLFVGAWSNFERSNTDRQAMSGV